MKIIAKVLTVFIESGMLIMHGLFLSLGITTLVQISWDVRIAVAIAMLLLSCIDIFLWNGILLHYLMERLNIGGNIWLMAALNCLSITLIYAKRFFPEAQDFESGFITSSYASIGMLSCIALASRLGSERSRNSNPTVHSRGPCFFSGWPKRRCRYSQLNLHSWFAKNRRELKT